MKTMIWIIIGAVLLTIFSVACLLVDAMVLSLVWNMFIPKIFPVVPGLSLASAGGIILVKMCFNRVPNKKTNDEAMQNMQNWLVNRLFVLLSASAFYHVIFI